MPRPERFGRLSRASLVAGLLLSVYVLLAATSVRHKSMTFDELGHLTGGVSAWLTGDYRLFPQNGQLPQRWAGLPLVALGFRFPSLDQPAWRSSNLESMGYQFLYGVGNDHEALVWSARVAMIPVGVLVGLVCYAWSRRLFGAAGGIVTLGAFVFSPSMLAHGPLATSDVLAALLFTASLGSVWNSLHRVGPLRLLGSSLLMGLLFVTKMSAFIMMPVALLLVAIRVWDGRPATWAAGRRFVVSGRRALGLMCAAILLVHVLVVVVTIWTFYGFRYHTFRVESPGGDQQFLGETIDTIADGAITRPLIVGARDLRLLPEAYLFGFAHVLDRSGKFVGFLNGRYSVDGWWSFFPYTWLVKTPLSLFALFGLAAAAGWPSRGSDPVRSRRRRWRAWYRLIPLVTFLAAYWAMAVSSSLNLGERHVLPTYPALFILAGGAAGWIGRRRMIGTAAVGVVLIALSIESMAIWPHYLSYFNRIAGGPAQGYRHLVDSSLDWGQDLPGLKRWLDARQGRSDARVPVYLSYFGSANPATYGIETQQIYSYQDWRSLRPLYELTGGIYCVSATMLQSIYTRAPGPWAAPYETAYQRARLEIERLPATWGDPASWGGVSDQETAYWRRLSSDFDQLRLARLSAYLRHREPDDQIGYSILIFQLSDEEVREALDGPPAELWPSVGIEGW